MRWHGDDLDMARRASASGRSEHSPLGWRQPGEFLNDPADLEGWLDVVRPRLPRHRIDLPESFDQHDLDAFRELRELLIDIFSASSEGKAAPAAALRHSAHTCLSHPVIKILDEAGPAWDAPEDQRPMTSFSVSSLRTAWR